MREETLSAGQVVAIGALPVTSSRLFAQQEVYMIYFFIGLMIGAVAGLFVGGACDKAKRADECADCEARTIRMLQPVLKSKGWVA